MQRVGAKLSRWAVLLIGVTSLAVLASKSSSALQDWQQPTPLDPTAGITSPALESQHHQLLPEQYIWTSGQIAKNRYEPRYFRFAFSVSEKPQKATLYVVGPQQAAVYLNGQLLGNFREEPTSGLRPWFGPVRIVFFLDVSQQLKEGRNLLALRVVGGDRDRGGDRVAAKIVPRGPAEMAPALLMSGPGWKFSMDEQVGWEHADFDDSNWKPVVVLGGIENNFVNDFFQGPWDAKLYLWPGYDGLSPFLAQLPLPAMKVLQAFEGLGRFDHLDSLTASSPSSGSPEDEFQVSLPSTLVSQEQLPSLVLDFGRETAGRLEVSSDSSEPMKLEIAYGESLGEALHEPFLGTNPLWVPPYSTVYGAKSAFRYARIHFLEGSSPLRFKAIRLNAIYYPVKYEGAFESSDPLLNRIWTVGAYTAHLCMQDDIWDGPKRDRGRWIDAVTGRVIDTAFADHFLRQQTMDRIVREAGNPVAGEVNGIAGFSAFWVMTQADYYRHFADKDYLHSIHDSLLQLLSYMQTELDSRNLFVNARKSWVFVDWSPALDDDSPEARRVTQLLFCKAFSDGAWLLQEDGDNASSVRIQAQADLLKAAAQRYLVDESTKTFGSRHQTNAMAILSGVANAPESQAIWDWVLSRPPEFSITPYYNFFVVTAMADIGHRREALDLIRNYWGGMIKEGATSMWETYDPRWPKGAEDVHRYLQAGPAQGYTVSLAMGWSSGATAWLTEQLLGIQPLTPGFREVSIRPDLMDLEWARGAEPTPHGLIRVDYRRNSDGLDVEIDLPPEVAARVSMPIPADQASIVVNGKPMKGTSAEGGSRLVVRLEPGAHYSLNSAGK